MDHDALMELTVAELAALLAQNEQSGTRPECLDELLAMVVVGMREGITKR